MVVLRLSYINRSQQLVKRNLYTIFRRLCTKNDNDDENNTPTEGENGESEFPEAPTSCCMSGCANCVWLEYAEKLTKYFQDGGEQAVKEINEKIEDPSVRSFILHELRMRKIAPKKD